MVFKGSNKTGGGWLVEIGEERVGLELLQKFPDIVCLVDSIIAGPDFVKFLNKVSISLFLLTRLAMIIKLKY